MSDWRQRTSVKFRSNRLVLSTDFRELQAIGACLRNEFPRVLIGISGRIVGWLWGLGQGGSPEFEEVVGQADELPFGVHLLKSSQGELAEAGGLFDLSPRWFSEEQGGFDLSFSLLVDRAALFGSQRAGHTLLGAEPLGDAAARDWR